MVLFFTPLLYVAVTSQKACSTCGLCSSRLSRCASPFSRIFLQKKEFASAFPSAGFFNHFSAVLYLESAQHHRPLCWDFPGDAEFLRSGFVVHPSACGLIFTDGTAGSFRAIIPLD
jgi:hypothetical protein